MQTELNPILASDTGRGGFRHLRWGVALLLFLAAILNYIDRQTLSILAPTIQADLTLSEAGYKWVVHLFLIAYTISLLLSGRLVDWLGTRLSMLLFVGWWSVANLATGLARGPASLGACRFALGLGEAGNWPASTKAVAEWFPANERAFAIGFYTLGATIGATVAPVLVNLLAGRFGWQSAFIATGAIGLVWLVPWFLFYRRPEEHPLITREELARIRSAPEPPGPDGAPHAAAGLPSSADAPVAGAAPESELQRWRRALSNRAVWGLMLGRMLSDPVWFFYQFWFAKYLFSHRAVTQQGLSVTTFVYLAADGGSLLGGLASGFLVRRHVRTARARLWVMLACAAVMPLSMLVPGVMSVPAVVAIGMAVVFAHLAWLANVTALSVDLIPRSLVATCFGVVAMGSSLGGLAMNEAVGKLAERGTYHPWFVAMGFLHPVAWLVVWALAVRGAKET